MADGADNHGREQSDSSGTDFRATAAARDSLSCVAAVGHTVPWPGGRAIRHGCRRSTRASGVHPMQLRGYHLDQR